ncbi:MAG: biotin--[acetyl-CoA-carboxylase] ligase [Planctomycetes bacterium]|nr:biotin--[acetyl-CoA-carboxylase] ligase [Planctomycetota bacterium]
MTNDSQELISPSPELNARLLAMLKIAEGRRVAVREIEGALRLGTSGLERDVEQLESLGFEICMEDSHLMLVGAPDLLHPDEIREGLGTRIIGRDVIAYDRVASTNDIAWELAEGGAGEGIVVLAEEQSSGRGRLGRRWHSPRGGLWMSIVVRPDPPEGGATALTMAASVAVARAIRSCPGCHATIRWPNDILLGGMKVAGVLVETRSTGNVQGAFILGIGVDVNCPEFPEDIKGIATAVSQHASGPVRRAEVARSILQNLDELYLRISDGEHAAIGQEWLAMSSTIGRRITIIQNGRTYKGEVVDMDPIDGLMVRLDRGFVRNFKGEHVAVVK